MEKVNIDMNNELRKIEDYANYLVSLFFKTNCKYKCYRTKINRLLIIYKLCDINNLIQEDSNYELLIDKDKKQFGFPFIFDKFDKDIYIPYLCVEENGKIIKDKINNSIEIPKEYNFNFLDDYSYSLIILEKIFRNFGNFSRDELNILLREIIQNIPIDVNVIDINKFKSFINSDVLPDNKVLNFIKCNYIETKNIHKDKNNTKKYNLTFFAKW